MPSMIVDKMEGMDIKKICIVMNPISGGGNAPPAVEGKTAAGLPTQARACHGAMKLPCESFLEAMTRLNPEIEIKIARTEYSGHAAVLAEEAARDGYHIVAAGGDGTMCEANNGLRRAPGCAKMPIGFIGSGTMNFFGINLGQESPVRLAEVIQAGTYRDISMAIANDAGGLLPKNEVITFSADAGFIPTLLSWQDYFRQTFVGPSKGIAFGALQAMLFPYNKNNHARIRIKVWPTEGSSEEILEAEIPNCLWLAVTVNHDFWEGNLQAADLGVVSWTTCEHAWPISRILSFVKLPMELTAGKSHLHENFMHYSKIEIDPLDGPDTEWSLALDGDHKRVKGKVTIEQKRQALRMMCLPKSAGIPPRADRYFRPVQDLGLPTSELAAENCQKRFGGDRLPVAKPSIVPYALVATVVGAWAGPTILVTPVTSLAGLVPFGNTFLLVALSALIMAFSLRMLNDPTIGLNLAFMFGMAACAGAGMVISSIMLSMASYCLLFMGVGAAAAVGLGHMQGKRHVAARSVQASVLKTGRAYSTFATNATPPAANTDLEI